MSQLDYNSRLRLSLCFFRLKNLVVAHSPEDDGKVGVASSTTTTGDADEFGCTSVGEEAGGVASSSAVASGEVVRYKPFKFFQPGMLQEMMTEVRCKGVAMCIIAR